MKAYDFEFDKLALSNLGFIICKFNSSSGGFETVSNGSQITFNTIPVLSGAKYERISTKYDTCLSATFQICKNSCVYGKENLEITVDELRYINKWLGRKGFHKFKILDSDYLDIYYEGSFERVDRIELDGKLYGLELSLITNRPFALHEQKKIIIKNTKKNGKAYITDTSDEEETIYPFTEIEIAEDGDLVIHNDFNDNDLVIKNCTSGEVITLDYPYISSSIDDHKLQNDFNWNFFSLCNTFRTGKNNLTISIPCTVKIAYSPTIKLGI